MGSGNSKSRVPGVALDCDQSKSLIAIDDGTVIKTSPDEYDWRRNTIVSRDAVTFTKRSNEKIHIEIQGEAVLRVGLTTGNPRTQEHFLQHGVFEIEDVFAETDSTRVLFINEYALNYGPESNEHEYHCRELDKNLWLYIIVIYGNSQIQTKLGQRSLVLTHLDDETQDTQLDMAKINPNTEVCRMRDRIVIGATYKINWKMMLENEKVAGKFPKYGLMKIRLVTKTSTQSGDNISTSQADRASGSEVFKFGSAVYDMDFNGTIALRVNNSCIEHNLMVHSADATAITATIPEPIGHEHLYMEVQFSSGELKIVHAPASESVTQSLGGTYLVTCKSEYAENSDIKLDFLSHAKAEPMMIQYGKNPLQFVVNMRGKLDNTGIVRLKHGKCKSITPEDVPRSIQVHVLSNGDLTVEEIEDYFTRWRVGGGVVDHIRKDTQTGCWIVTFANATIARNVIMHEKHVIENSDQCIDVCVMPFYSKLGIASQPDGSQSKFDMTPLVVKNLDLQKLTYLKKRDTEKQIFERYINKVIRVNVKWDVEFEDDSDENEDSITINCKPTGQSPSKLVVWKKLIQDAVQEYFSQKLFKKTIKVDEDKWGTTVEALEKTASKEEVVMFEERSRLEVTLVSSKEFDDTMFGNVKRTADEETKTIKSLTMSKYNCMKEEGVLVELEQKYPSIKFRVNYEDERVEITGAKNEITDALKSVLSGAVNVRELHIQMSKQHMQFFRTDKGKEFIGNVFKEKQINSEFWLDDNDDFLIMVTCISSQDSVRTAQIKELIQSSLYSDVYEVDLAYAKTLHSDSWSTFKSDKEEQYPIVFTIENSEVTITGSKPDVKTAKTEVVAFFKKFGEGKEIVTVPPIVAEFLDNYEKDEHCCKFLTGTSDEYTGVVEITGKPNELEKGKAKLLKDVKSVTISWVIHSKHWMASAVEDLPIGQLQNTNKCLIQADTGDSLAANNIECIVVHGKSGATLQAKVTDIELEVVNAIVNRGDPKMEFKKGMAAELVKRARGRVQEECQKFVNGNGDVEVGGAICSGPGRLRCLKIIHCVIPIASKCGGNAEELMKKAVQAVLKIAADNKYISVAIPALGCDTRQYPEDLVFTHIVQAVVEFLEKNSNSTLKEIYLCDRSPKLAKQFADAIEKLKTPWECFRHGRKLDIDKNPVTQEGNVPRPPSSKRKTPLLKGIDLKDSFLWGGKNGKFPGGKTIRWNPRGGGNTSNTHLSSVGETTEDDDDPGHGSHGKSCYGDGLPYRIPVTTAVKLHIVSGNLARQRADVIVNVTPSYPDVQGNLSKAIVVDGGLEDEWKKIGKIGYYEVKSTGHGHLRCKNVYHVIAPTQNSRGKDNFMIIQNIVKECLGKAEDDGVESIALPVINHGRLADNKVADAMVKAVCMFANTNPSTCLSDVYIVIFFSDYHTVKVFENEIPNLLQVDEVGDIGAQSVSQVTMRVRNTAVYKEPLSTEDHTAADDVAVFRLVYLNNGDTLKKKLVEMIGKEIITKEFSFTDLSDENLLSAKEEACLKSLEQTHRINVEILKTKMKVTVTGLKKRVDKCELDVVKFLYRDFPEWRNKQQLEKHVIKTIQWHFDDNGTKRPFDATSNFQLYLGFIQGKDFTYYNADADEEYVVDVGQQREHPKLNKSKRRQIYQRTKDIGDMSVPDEWSIKSTQTGSAQVTLNPTDQEFNTVKALVIKDGLKPTSITNIIRLEHKYMWLMYQAKKSQIEKQNPAGTQNERLLWHGTDDTTVQLIIRGGYDRSFCGKNATAYGNGAYFAPSSLYSNGYAVPDGGGTCRMFLNRVLTGEYCLGYSGLNYLPEKTRVKNIPVLYDSATNYVATPAMFIIFHDAQVYPEYLIEYKR